MEKSDGAEASVASSTSTLHKKIRFPKEEESAKGEEALQEYKQNPLDIPEIVAIVVGHLSEVGDLKSVRTQSRAWRDETLSKWRNSVVFLINDETLPVLVKAFKDDLGGLSEEDKAAAIADRDTYRLREVPFKRYRFANDRGGQPWTYPLDKEDVEGTLIWEKVISPQATFLDVGECSLRFLNQRLGEVRGHYLPGLKWILRRCPNLKEFAMAPYKSNESMEDLSESEDEGEEDLLDGEVSYAERLRRRLQEKLNRFKNPFLTLKRFKAPQINALTISTPQQVWKKSAKNERSLEYLFNYGNEQCRLVGQFIIGGMINLKTLRLPSGGGATLLIKGLSRSVNREMIKLESLTAFASDRKHYLKPSVLYVNLRVTHAPIRELYMSLTSQSYGDNFEGIPSILSLLETTLEKLELEVNCEPEGDSLSSSSSRKKKTIIKPDFSLWGCDCERLTHFKMTLDYETFPGDLGIFDLNNLELLPNLKDFHFGMKDKVEEAWVTRKLDFDDGLGSVGKLVPLMEELTDLKSFHFHGNFTKKALKQLGGITENLETLEVVLDEENCNVVGEVWPRLKNLKLLEGSDVPDEFLSNLKKSNPSLQRLEYL